MVETAILTDNASEEEPVIERKFSVPIAQFVLARNRWEVNTMFSGSAFGIDAAEALTVAESQVEAWNKKIPPDQFRCYKIVGSPVVTALPVPKMWYFNSRLEP